MRPPVPPSMLSSPSVLLFGCAQQFVDFTDTGGIPADEEFVVLAHDRRQVRRDSVGGFAQSDGTIVDVDEDYDVARYAH